MKPGIDMDESDRSINKMKLNLTTLIKFKDGKASEVELENSLDALLAPVREHGLPPQAIDLIITLLNKLTKNGDELDLRLKFLYILIPSNNLSGGSIKDLLHWFESDYHSNSNAVQNFTFWLLAAIRIGVIEKEYVRVSHYYTLFQLLLDNPQEDALSFCLKELTQYHHVSELSLSRLYDCYKSTTKKRYVAVLLKKFVQIKSQYAEALKIKKLVKSPSLTLKDKIMNKSLQSLLTLHIVDKSLDNTLNDNDQFDESCTASYFGLTPIYSNEEGIKVTTLMSINEVVDKFDSLVIPHNLVSLLGSKCGQYYVSFASKEWQNLLEEQVSAILTCFLNNHPRPEINYNLFFKALAETQAACCYGMPCVSYFLKDYLVSWDGCKYRDGVIGLIPWFHFNHFKELDVFMHNLFNVFISMTLDSKMKVIDAFSDLYLNMWVSATVKDEKYIPFLGSQASWMKDNTVNIINSLAKYFQAFVNTGLVFYKTNPAYISQVLQLYYKIFLIDKKTGFFTCSMLPQMAVFLSQTSSSLTVLNLLCKILLMYWKDHKIINSSPCGFENLNNVIQHYCSDTVRILLQGVEGDKLDCLMIGRLFHEPDQEQFSSCLFGMKNIMSAPNNLATSHIIYELARKLRTNINKLKPENFGDLLELTAPDCAALIRESANFFVETTVDDEDL